MRERIKKANKLREMLRSVLKWRKTIEFINGVNKSLGGVAEKTGLVEAREAGTAQRKSAVPSVCVSVQSLLNQGGEVVGVFKTDYTLSLLFLALGVEKQNRRRADDAKMLHQRLV